jgi:hypothetical protein
MHGLLEFLRRGLLIALVVGGLGLALWPGSPLLVVSEVDFRADFEGRPSFSSADRDDPEAFRDFVTYRTEGRTVDVAAQPWLDLVQRMLAMEPEMSARRLNAGIEDHFVFRTDEPPFADTGPWPEFRYLRIDQGRVWLAVSRSFPNEIMGLPRQFAFPGRPAGLVMIAVGLVVYVLLPRRRSRPGEMRYGRFASVIGADLVGLLILSLCGLLPLLIVWSNDPGGSVFSGWIVIAIPLWIMAALGAFLLGVGWFYAAFSWVLGERALLRRTWAGVERIPADAIARVEPYCGRMGRILGALLVLSGRPGLVGQGILVAGNEEFGAKLTLDDGRTVRVMANHLDGFPTILGALVQWGVPGAAPVDQFFE